MSDSVRPHRQHPTRFPIPGILQARTLAWVAISFSNAWKWNLKSLSRVQHLVTPWTAAHQAPPSMGFSRQEYWSGLPLPSLFLCLTGIKSSCSGYSFESYIFTGHDVGGAKSIQSVQLCSSKNCCLPGSSVCGIFQVRTLEWIAISSPEDLPDPGPEPESCMPPAWAGRLFTTSATWVSLMTL